MQVFARTEIGLVRPINEDSFLASQEHNLFAVADGMGGHEAGEIASSAAIKLIAEYWQNATKDDAGQIMLDSCLHANSGIFQMAGKSPKLSGMGTTVTAAAILGSRLIIGHVGDSRAYLFREGQLRQLTQDHSLVEEMLRQGTITQQEALYHPQRNVITRALGTQQKVVVDLLETAWLPDDLLLLCTDGLSNQLSQDEMESWLLQMELEKALDKMVQTVLDRGGFDNITLLAVLDQAGKGGA